MKNEFLNTVTTLLKRAYPNLATTHQLAFKNVFGAVAGRVDGNIFISCGRFGVALKLPPETLSDLFKEKGVRHLKYFSDGHIKKEYAVLPRRIVQDRQRLKKLVDLSVEYVLPRRPD